MRRPVCLCPIIQRVVLLVRVCPPLKEVREIIGGSGGLYPWLKQNGADILEKKPGYGEFRIRKKFYAAMLSLFLGTDQGILRLQGLGKDIWAGIDAQDYVHRERAAWAG